MNREIDRRSGHRNETANKAAATVEPLNHTACASGGPREVVTGGRLSSASCSRTEETITMSPELQIPPTVEEQTNVVATEPVATALDSLRRKLDEQKDLNLRLVADFANFRRRTREDAESKALTQKESFIHELLPVLDNLERALASSTSAVASQFRQGVEMTMQQLQQLLRQHGIETQESAGQPFNPHLHEAVSQSHDPARPDHAILEVLQRGYRRGAKVIRPAKVVINELHPH